MTELNRPISRRRVLAGAGAGAAAIWAAPAITTLARAGAAGSRCSVFLFDMDHLTSPGLKPSTALTGTFTAHDSLSVVPPGNVDLVGPGTDYPDTSGYTPTVAMDLDGTGEPTNTTILQGPSLSTNTYIVEVEVYGSLDTNNSLTVTIGGTTLIGPTGNVSGPTNLQTFTTPNPGVSAGGTLELTHTSGASPDNMGMFLRRLEVFLANCGQTTGTQS